MTITHLTWGELNTAADALADRHRTNPVAAVYGVPTGGVPVALLIAQRLSVPVADNPHGSDTLIVDDLADSGATAARYSGARFDTLYRKPHTPSHVAPNAWEMDGWLAFPWENDNGDPTDAVRRLIQHIGEDPTRDGLLDTPKRVTKALRELTSGYQLDPADILTTTFDVDFDEMIAVRQIPFSSLCEHHMLPFHGTATVAYIPAPGGRIVGLSKLARLVDLYARRLQVQERLTTQIAEAVEHHLQPLGTAVLITATHTCMSMRGIGKAGQMVTSKLTGAFRTEPDCRHEFLDLAKP